jgi:hypothetical protein
LICGIYLHFYPDDRGSGDIADMCNLENEAFTYKS